MWRRSPSPAALQRQQARQQARLLHRRSCVGAPSVATATTAGFSRFTPFVRQVFCPGPLGGSSRGWGRGCQRIPVHEAPSVVSPSRCPDGSIQQLPPSVAHLFRRAPGPECVPPRRCRRPAAPFSSESQQANTPSPTHRACSRCSAFPLQLRGSCVGMNSCGRLRDFAWGVLTWGRVRCFSALRARCVRVRPRRRGPH